MSKKEILDQLRASIVEVESGRRAERVGAAPFVSGDEQAYSAENVPCEEVKVVFPTNEADEADRAFKKIVALVNASDKSEKGIRQRLAKSGFEEDSIDLAVEKAIKYGLIDDSRYADILIRSRISQGKGSAGIERELKENGIDPFSIEGWPEEYGVEPDAELDRALALLDRKPPRSKNVREGAFRKLVQAGYPVGIASAAARQWSDLKRQ